MDERTLQLLEFDKILRLVEGFAGSSLGKERIRALAPSEEVEKIEAALALTAEMVEALGARLTPPLGGLHDIFKAVKRARLGLLLEIETIREIRDVLELSGRVRDYWVDLGTDYPRLGTMLADVEDMRHLANVIDNAIDERGIVRDNASPELKRIREELHVYDERIQVELKRLLRQPDIQKALRYHGATVSGHHHVLPVAVNHRHKVEGVVHRASASGETVYIEPARVAEISAEMTLLRAAEQREIRRVLRELTGKIGNETKAILTSLEVMADLDALHAKARFSIEHDLAVPEIGAKGALRLVYARHPLLLQQAKEASRHGEERSVVPIDIRLGDPFHILVITGPNTGGKTVALKTVGLLSVMALSGLPIPARPTSRVPIIRNILADIGDEQSIEQSLSTFSSHVGRIAKILSKAHPKTLVLLDELGAGTEPSEGAALGRSILDELASLGSFAMVTTHLGALKKFALSTDKAENAAVEFDPETLRPTYRLMIGQTGESCALRIARRLNLPDHVLERAEKYHESGRDARDIEEESLQRLRHDAERQRLAAEEAKEQATNAAEEFRKKTELLEQEAIVKEQITKARESLRPGDRVRVPRFDKTGTVVRVDRRRGEAAVTVGAVEWQIALDDLIPTQDD
ncbi:Endonuclease MutS2 [Planctomycetes bacterium Pan216]|uniref:Endonuclease MutS2 n=1 Tax=Kolteria novifilia TaxID=2527975 RepID=A0A518B4J7_9BACT|nr:Endonuclease MutS2 [Planctomycetes bacterium Pan216]